MPYLFYSDPKYRQKQSEKTKLNWKNGLHNSLISPIEERKCKNQSCQNRFFVKIYDHKTFCSNSCAAHVNNIGRIQSSETRKKFLYL